jgi:hypothetical protein
MPLLVVELLLLEALTFPLPGLFFVAVVVVAVVVAAPGITLTPDILDCLLVSYSFTNTNFVP